MSSAQYYQWLWEFLNLYSTDYQSELFQKTLSLSMFLLLHVMGRTRDSVMGSIWSGHVARMCSVSKVSREGKHKRKKLTICWGKKRLDAIGCFGVCFKEVSTIHPWRYLQIIFRTCKKGKKKKKIGVKFFCFGKARFSCSLSKTSHSHGSC